MHCCSRSARGGRRSTHRDRHRRKKCCRISGWIFARPRAGCSSTPGFTAAALITIALGVGANAAIFGVAKSLLLDSLPYADADGLVRVYGRLLDGSRDRGPLTAAGVSDIAERQQSFASLAAFNGLVGDAVLGTEDGPRVVKVAWVEPGLFDTLGVPPAQGRMFRSDEAASGLVPLSGGQEGDDTASAVVISHAAWQRIFGGDPKALGRSVLVSGIARTVVGVLPADFVGMAGEADFYFAFDIAPVVAHPIFARRSGWLGLVGRLKPGVSYAAAQAEIATLWQQIAAEHPADYGTQSVTTLSMRDAVVGDTRTPLLILLASGALVLLVACANLAGVMLSRALSRRREFAVRVALGAGRSRLVRQLLSESVLLGLAGGAAGLLLATRRAVRAARAARAIAAEHTRRCRSTAAPYWSPRWSRCWPVSRFGSIPAFATASADPQSVLREEARGTSETRRSRTLRGTLVACQLALSISLLVGAGLLGRSLFVMSSAPLGFAPEGVLTATVRLPPREYATPEAREAFYEQFSERLRGLPGVQSGCDGFVVADGRGAARGTRGRGRACGRSRAIRSRESRLGRLFPLAADPAEAGQDLRCARSPHARNPADGDHQRERGTALLAQRRCARRSLSIRAQPRSAARRSGRHRRRRPQRHRAARRGADDVLVDAAGLRPRSRGF